MLSQRCFKVTHVNRLLLFLGILLFKSVLIYKKAEKLFFFVYLLALYVRLSTSLNTIKFF